MTLNIGTRAARVSYDMNKHFIMPGDIVRTHPELIVILRNIEQTANFVEFRKNEIATVMASFKFDANIKNLLVLTSAGYLGWCFEFEVIEINGKS